MHQRKDFDRRVRSIGPLPPLERSVVEAVIGEEALRDREGFKDQEGFQAARPLLLRGIEAFRTSAGRLDQVVKLALFDLISAGNTHGVCQLLDNDHGLLEARNEENQTPLMFAAREDSEGLIEVLVQRGADLEATDPNGRRALHYAAQWASRDAIALLIRSGVDVMARTARGETALMVAGGCGDSRSVKVELLLEHMRGRGLDWQDWTGQTALYRAGKWSPWGAARLLLYAGADHTLPDVDGTTCLMAASRWPFRPSTVELLKWWDVGLERRYVFCKARSIEDMRAANLRAPALPVPAILQARVAAGLALPSVAITVVEKDEEQIALEEKEEKRAAQRGKRAASLRMKIGRRKRYEGDCELRAALVLYVLNDLPSELSVELMALFHNKTGALS